MEGEETEEREIIFLWQKNVQRKLIKSFPDVKLKTLKKLHKNIYEEFHKLDWKDKERTLLFYGSLKNFYLHFSWKIKWKNESHLVIPCVQLLYYMSCIVLRLSNGNSATNRLNEILLLLKTFPGDAYLICDVLLLIRNVKQKSYPAYAAITKFILKDEDLKNPDAECFIKMMLLFRRLICLSTNCVEKADVSSLALAIKRPPDVINWLSSLSMDGLGDITLKNVTQRFLKKKLKHKVIQNLFMILFEKKYDKEILNPERFSSQKIMLSNDNNLKRSKRKVNRKSKIELSGKYPKKHSHKKIKKIETTTEVQLGKLKIESCAPHSNSARNKKHKNNLALTKDKNKASKLLSCEFINEKIRENCSEYVRNIEMHKIMLKTNESSEHLTSNSQKTKKRSMSQIEDSLVETVSFSSRNKKRKRSDSVNGEFGERVGVLKESEVHLAKSSDGLPPKELISFDIGESCKGHEAETSSSSFFIGEHFVENIEKSEQMMPNCRSPTVNMHVSIEFEKSSTSNAVFDNRCNKDNESCNVDSKNFSISNNKSELSVQRNFSFQDDMEYCNEVNNELSYQKSHESSDLVSAKDFWGNASSRKRKCTIVSDKPFELTDETKCSADPSTESLALIQENHNFPNSHPTLLNGVSNDFISAWVEDEEICMTDECDISSNNVLKGSHLAIAQSSPLHSITGTTENAIEKYIVNQNESSSLKIRNGICPLPVQDKNDALTLDQEKHIPLELRTDEKKDGTKYQHYFLYDSEANSVTKPSPIFSSSPSCKHSLQSSPESLDLKDQSHVSTTSVNVDILEKSKSIYTSSDFSETAESNICLSSPTKNLQASSKDPVSNSKTFHSLSESNSIIQTAPSFRKKKAKKHRVKSKQFISESDSDSSCDEQNAARQTIPIISIGMCSKPVVNSIVSSLREKKPEVSKKTYLHSLCSSENSPSEINDKPVNIISNSKSFSSNNLKYVCNNHSNQLNSVEVVSSSSSNSPGKKVSSTPNNSKSHMNDSPLNANSESSLQPSLALNSNSSGKKYFLRSSPKLRTLGLRSEKRALKSDLNNTLESNHSNSVHSASNTTFESNSSARNDLESDSASDDSNQNVDPKRFIDWSASEADPNDLMSELEGESDQNFIVNSSDCSDFGDQCVSDSSEHALSHKSVSTHNSACSSRDSSPIRIKRKSHRQNVSSSSSASSSENSSREKKRKSTKLIYKKCIVESSENESGDEVVTDDGNKILDHKLVFRNSSGSFPRNSSLDWTRKSKEGIVCKELNIPEQSTSETLNFSNQKMNKENTQIRKCVVVIEDCIASQKYSVSPSSKNRVVETDDTKGNDLCVSNGSEEVLNQKCISQENSACSLKNASLELQTGSLKMLPEKHMECDSNASDDLYASNNNRQMQIDDTVYKNSQDLFPTLCFESNKQQSIASESNVNVSVSMENSSSLSENSIGSEKRSYSPPKNNTSYFSDSGSSASPHQHVSSGEEMSDKKLHKVRKLPRKSNSSQNDLNKKYQTAHPLSSTEDEFGKTHGYIHSNTLKCKSQKRKKSRTFRNNLNQQYEIIHPLSSTEDEFDKSHRNIHSNTPRCKSQEREKSCKIMKSKKNLEFVSSASLDQPVSSDEELLDKNMHKVKKLPRKSNSSENDLNKKYQTTHPLSSTEDEFGKTNGNIHSETPKCKSQKRRKSRTFRNNLNRKYEIIHPLSSTDDEFDKSYRNIHSNTPKCELQEREKSCKIMKSKKSLESISSAFSDQHVSSDKELLDKKRHKVKNLPRKSNSSENDLNKKYQATHPLSSTEDECSKTCENIHSDTPKCKSQKRKKSCLFRNNLNKKYEIIHPLSSTEDEFHKKYGNSHSNTPKCKSQEREKSCKIIKSKKILESDAVEQNVLSSKNPLSFKLAKEATPANCSKDMPLSEVIKQMESNTEANLIDSPNLCLNSSLEQLHEKNLHECSQRNGNASNSLEDSSFSAIHQEINNNFSLTFQKSENAFVNLTESAQPEEKAKKSAEESVEKLKEKKSSSGCVSEESTRVETPGSLFDNVFVPETENLSSCNQQLSDIEKGTSSQLQPNIQDLFSLVKEWCKKNGISACTKNLSSIQSDPEKRNMSHENVTLANEEYLLVKFMEELQGDSSLVTSEDHIHQSFLNYFLDSVEDKNGSLPSLENNTLEYLHDLAKTKSGQKSDMSFKTENLGNFPINNAENLKVGSNETSNSWLSNSHSKAKCEVLIISPRKKCNLNWNQNQKIVDLNTPSKAFSDQNDTKSFNYPKQSTNQSCSQQSCEFDVDMNETLITEQNITQNCYSKSNNFAPETYFDHTPDKQANKETLTGMVDYQNQCSSDNAIEQNEKGMRASHIKKKSCKNSSVPAESISHLSNKSKKIGTLDSTSIKCCVSICSSVSKCNNEKCGGNNISVDRSNGLFVNASAGHIFGNGLNLSSMYLFPVVNLGKRCDKIARNSASNPEIKSHSVSIDRTCENQTLRTKKLKNSYLRSGSVIKKENSFSKPVLKERSVGMHKHSSEDSNSQTNDESEHQKPARYNLRLRRRVT